VPGIGSAGICIKVMADGDVEDGLDSTVTI